MKVVITGGAGYIGSHIALNLLEQGYAVTVLDNLCNSSAEALIRVQQLTGKTLTFIQGDVRHRDDVERLFDHQQVDAVIHMAGLKSVNESVQEPVRYHQTNVAGTLTLLEVMKKQRCDRLIFSSSATVYGSPSRIPLDEECHAGKTTNPYGASKYFVENVVREIVTSQETFSVMALRYFNPAGAHPSGLMGEYPEGIPNNLLPYLFQVASRQRPALPVFGTDYDTPDGSGVRDYIHVMDLAEAHIQALQKLKPGSHCYNIGTGKGYSVLEIVQTFEKVSGIAIPLDFCSRRPGDVAVCLADASKAERELGWRATRGLEEMLRDAWRWHTKHPTGYTSGVKGEPQHD